ncbi:MAG: putative protein kinase [Streblomastix strix]|uniref:Protein kinase domain-containing protein n=1 Tax=Streblomastix strix TaxID=222440 RepID=A0A5J4V116_9EUKA|nr:MAG: putative protein kinase [Streblomastix strix]
MEYANMGTLNIVAQQRQIPLPSYVLRALMKQILGGIHTFHDSGLIHRDIKPDNILLNSPPGSGLVRAKISDFGFAKYEDLINEQTYTAGTIPYMAPEMFKKPLIVTQKVDIYALGITFYKLITHKYPVNEPTFEEQGKKINLMQGIERPPEITDNLLWNLLSKMLEFDPNKRIIAFDAHLHPFFESPEAIADISDEQKKLASLADVAYKNNAINNPSFIVAETEIKKFFIHYIQIQQEKQKQEQKLDEEEKKQKQILKNKIEQQQKKQQK